MTATLVLELPEETVPLLEEIADSKNTEPARLVHQWIREWLFNTRPGTSSLAAQASALLQRGSLPLLDGRRVTKEQLAEATPRFSFPSVPAETNGSLVVPLSSRVADILPRTVAFVELTMPRESRAQKDWNDLPSWAKDVVTGKAAEAGAEMDSKEAADDEDALFASTTTKPKKPKLEQKPT